MFLKGMIVALSLAGLTAGQDDANLRVSKMDRQSLHEYTLAKCSDGSPAAYYIDTVSFMISYYKIFKELQGAP